MHSSPRRGADRPQLLLRTQCLAAAAKEQRARHGRPRLAETPGRANPRRRRQRRDLRATRRPGIPRNADRRGYRAGVSQPELGDEELLACWHDVRTGIARMQARVEQVLEDTGVPVQWFPVLHLLNIAEDHRVPMSVLARDVGMTSGGFTKLADRMARERIIDRRGSDVDRRVVHASLTDTGLALAQRVGRVYVDALRSGVLAVISVAELQAAAEVMRRLGAAPAPPEGADNVVTARDPALPERRGRGRERE